MKCPFHEETEPSLSINEKTKLWQCFGCGQAGDAISLVQKIENIDFVAAVKKLAQQEGKLAKLEIETFPAVRTKTEQPINNPLSVQQQALLSKVMKFYHRVFQERAEGKAYLEKRGINNAALYTQFQIGYADGSLLTAVPADMISELTQLGILLEPTTPGVYRERFLNCVVFPLLDKDGQVVSFYGRNTLSEGGKHFYLPGERNCLPYGTRLKEKKPEALIITESIIDALSFMNKGIEDVIPIYGTNGFTKAHETLLKELQPKEIILALDGDEAGKVAAEGLQKKLSSFNRSSPDGYAPASCYICTFPNNQDANEYFMEHGAEDFWGLCSPETTSPSLDKGRCRVHPTEGCIYELKHVDLRQGKLTVTVKVVYGETFLLDTVNLYAQKQRENLVAGIMKLTGEKAATVETQVMALIARAEAQSKQPPVEEPTSPKMSDSEEKEALAFLKNPDILAQLVTDYETLGYTGEAMNKQLAYLVMTSRKLQNPLSLVIMSSSAAGKSSLQKATLDLCPPEEGKHFTRLTQQSLYYLGKDSLKHKFISIEEEEGSSEASYSLKTLLSAKVLQVATKTSDPQTGRMKAEEYITEGPVSVMVCTTSPEIEPELASRTLTISIDESREQTEAIHAKQRSARTLEGRVEQHKRKAVTSRHHNAQRLLEGALLVVNNYADQLTFPSDRIRYRRGQDHYLDLIEAIAFLRQHQKEHKTQTVEGETLGYIEVDKRDIELANSIFISVLGWSIDELKPPARTLLKTIIALGENQLGRSFTRRQIREELKWSNTHLHNHLRQLEELEYIIAVTGSNGSKYSYTLLYEGDGESTEKFVLGLKSPEELL